MYVSFTALRENVSDAAQSGLTVWNSQVEFTRILLCDRELINHLFLTKLVLHHSTITKWDIITFLMDLCHILLSKLDAEVQVKRWTLSF